MDEEELKETLEEKPEAVPAPKPPPLPVRVVAQEGKAALVEWVDDGRYRRAYIPADKVRDGLVERRTLERGQPYGLPWEDIIEITATPSSIANELRRRGIWTLEDLNTPAASKVNKAVNWGALVRKAKEVSNG